MSPQGGGTPGVPGPGEAWSWGWEGVLWGTLKAGLVSLGRGACSEHPAAQMFQLILLRAGLLGGGGHPRIEGTKEGQDRVCVHAHVCVCE